MWDAWLSKISGVWYHTAQFHEIVTDWGGNPFAAQSLVAPVGFWPFTVWKVTWDLIASFCCLYALTILSQVLPDDLFPPVLDLLRPWCPTSILKVPNQPNLEARNRRNQHARLPRLLQGFDFLSEVILVENGPNFVVLGTFSLCLAGELVGLFYYLFR